MSTFTWQVSDGTKKMILLVDTLTKTMNRSDTTSLSVKRAGGVVVVVV
jgi:hypothetical protein